MRSMVLLSLLLVVSIAPAAQAQFGGTGCTRQCAPTAPDVNGDVIKRGDEPVQLMLYAHFEDMLQPAPLNAQPPDAQRETDQNGGFLMPVIESNTPVEPANFHFKSNEFKLYSSPGLVEYGDEKWRIHQEPGLADELTIQGDEVTLYWYLSANAVPNRSSRDGPTVSVMPQVAIFARLETGRHPYHGQLIATTPDAKSNDLVTGQRVTVLSVPGQPDVYEFQVKMKVNEHRVPDTAEAQGFSLVVVPYQVMTEQRNGYEFMQGDWRLRTGAKFPNRVVLPVERTMDTKVSSMSLFTDRLFLRWSFISALGSYDMRDADMDIKIRGPQAVDERAIDLINLKKSIDHDGHFKPVNATWAIDYYQFPMADGEYEAHVSIPNLQQTYLLEHTFRFSVKDGLPQVPSLGRNHSPNGAVAEGSAKTVEPKGEAAALDLVTIVLLASLLAVTWRRWREAP